MHLSSSATDHNASVPSRFDDEQEQRLTEPVILGERSLMGLALMRLFVGLLWFQQLF